MSESDGGSGGGLGSNLRALRDPRSWELPLAYAYLIGLILLVVGGLGAAVHFGLADVNAQFTFQANLGFIIEWVAMLIFAVFAVFTFVMLVRVTGIGFMKGLIRTVAKLAHDYELPENSDLRGPEAPSSGSEPQGEGGQTGSSDGE